jgi:hypothetical protein
LGEKCITYDENFLIYDYICHKLIYMIGYEKLKIYFKSRVVNDSFACNFEKFWVVNDIKRN